MSDTTSTKFQEAWRETRTLLRLPDTPELRFVFYAGGRAALTEVIDAFVPSLSGINEELRKFCGEASDTPDSADKEAVPP